MKCQIQENKVSSPIGNWRIQGCQDGLHLIKLCDEVTNDNFLELGSGSVRLLTGKASECAEDFRLWSSAYFSGKWPTKEPKICPEVATSNSDTKFRQKVWLVLKENVQIGETISYGDLAKLCGKAGASRAVGSAMANNPISLIIPCHRVVKADGSTGNYSKCTRNNVKIWLLNHEKCISTNNN